MPVLDARPRDLDIKFRPGSTVTLNLNGPADWLDTRAYTATVNGVALSVSEDDDTLVIVASSVVTTALPTSGGPYQFVLTQTGGNVELVGQWTPSLVGSSSQTIDTAVVIDTLEVDVTIIGSGVGGGAPSGPAGGALGGTYPDPTLSAGKQAELDAKATTAALTTETNTRAAADTALDGRLDTIEAVGPLASVVYVDAEILSLSEDFAEALGEVQAEVDGKQPLAAVLTATTAAFTIADETKLDHLTVTQAVDLDTIEARVNSLDAAVVLRGGWDASAGTFPGGGTAQAGDSYIVTTGGTVNAVAFTVGDRVVAILDNASTTTYAANWLKLDYTDAVLSVDGRTGAVTLTDLYDAAGAAAAAQAAAVQRANHTGTQTLATISDAGTAAAANTGTGASNVPTITQADARYLKRAPLVTSITSSATPTFDTDASDVVNITALATAITSMTSGKTGTPQAFQKLLIRFKDDGTARAITWGADYEACGVPLPTTTVVNKRTTVGLIYSAVTSKWGCVAVAQEA